MSTTLVVETCLQDPNQAKAATNAQICTWQKQKKYTALLKKACSTFSLHGVRSLPASCTVLWPPSN